MTVPRPSMLTVRVNLLGDNYNAGKELFLQGHVAKLVEVDTARQIFKFLFHTNRASSIMLIVRNMNDAGLRDAVLDGSCTWAHCALLMFSLTSRITGENIPIWHRDITRVCGPIPFVLTGTHDGVTASRRAKQLTFHRKKKMPFCQLSHNNPNDDRNKPFLWLVRMLLRDNRLNFVPA